MNSFGLVGLTKDGGIIPLDSVFPMISLPGSLTKSSTNVAYKVAMSGNVVSRKVVSSGVSLRRGLEAATISLAKKNYKVKPLCKIRVK